MHHEMQFTPKELFEKYRSEISYDSNHILQRTSWFVTAQAFMFSAVVIGIERSNGVPWEIGSSLLHPTIPALGLFVSICVLFSVLGSIVSASRSRSALRRLFRTYPQLAQGLPQRTSFELWLGLAPSVLFPIVFGGTWAAMLFRVQIAGCI